MKKDIFGKNFRIGKKKVKLTISELNKVNELRECNMIKLKTLLMESKKIYYHASPHLFKKGQVLSIAQDVVKNHDSPTYGLGNRGIFVTYSKYPHGTIYDIALREKWYVYSVEVIGDMISKGRYGGEWIAHQVKIIDRIGRIQKGSNLSKYVSDYKYEMDDRQSGKMGTYKLFIRKVEK